MKAMNGIGSIRKSSSFLYGKLCVEDFLKSQRQNWPGVVYVAIKCLCPVSIIQSIIIGYDALQITASKAGKHPHSVSYQRLHIRLIQDAIKQKCLITKIQLQ